VAGYFAIQTKNHKYIELWGFLKWNRGVFDIFRLMPWCKKINYCCALLCNEIWYHQIPKCNNLIPAQYRIKFKLYGFSTFRSPHKKAGPQTCFYFDIFSKRQVHNTALPKVKLVRLRRMQLSYSRTGDRVWLAATTIT
jgi:hypothetical protein